MKKNYKLLLFIFLSLISSVVFVACSCKKVVKPNNLTLSYEQNIEQIFVGSDNAFSVSYSVSPNNAENFEVLISSSNINVLEPSKNSSTKLQDTVTITPKTVSYDPVTVMFKIKGTNISKSITARVYSTPQPLQAPSDLSYNHESGLVVFTPVTNIFNYDLKVVNVTDSTEELLPLNDDFYNASTQKIEIDVFTLLNLSQDMEYEISVKTKSTHFTNLDSLFSSAITIYQLSTPTGFANLNGLLSWNHNDLFSDSADNFISYELKINDQTFVVENNSYFYNFAAAGNYNVSIKTINTNKQEIPTVYDSRTAASLTVLRLATPTNLLLNNSVLDDNGQHGYSELSWSVIESSYGYKLIITPSITGQDDTVIILDGKNNNKIVIDDRFEADIEYTVVVLALGDGASVLTGESSEIKFTKVDSVSNLGVNNSILSFSALSVFTAVFYEIELSNATNTILATTNQATYNLSNITTQAGVYNVYVRSLATHNLQSGKFYANSEKTEVELTVKKLANPLVDYVDNSSNVYWKSIADAVNYDVYFNNTKITTVAGNLPGDQNMSVKLSDFATILSGDNNVAVVAIGQGQNINSSITDKVDFDFIKLNTPSTFTIVNDVIGWNDINNITNYSVAFNSDSFSLIGTNASFTVSGSLPENNLFKVRAIGNNYNVINSEIAEYSVNKLLIPEGLKVVDGVFHFNYNENNYYKLFINGDTQGVVATNGTYNFDYLTAGESVEVGVKAYPKSDIVNNYYLSSEVSYATVEKLSAPTGVVSQLAGSDYVVSWNEVEDSTGYYAYIFNSANDLVYNQFFETTSFTIPNSLTAGGYKINIVARGDINLNLDDETIGYLNSNKSVNYEVTKLTFPINIRVDGGILKWSAGINANGVVPLGYEVYFKDSANLERTFTTTNTQLDFNDLGISNLISGSYTIKIKALGNSSQIITSTYSSDNAFTILNSTNNLRIESGVVKWNITGHTGLTITYDVYLIDYNNNVSLIAQNVTETSYTITQNLITGQEYGVYIVAKANGYLNSKNSSVLNFEKLTTVENFNISGSVFTWNLVANASKYHIVTITGANEVLFAVVDGAVNTYAFNQTQSGTYKFAIYSVGSSVGDYGFVNSNKSSELTVTVLSRVTNIRLENGILKWNFNYTPGDENNTPNYYELSLYNNNGGILEFIDTYPVANNVNTFDTSVLSGGTYRVEIVSVGNGSTKINSLPTILGSFEKISAEQLNLRTQNGVITWTPVSGALNASYDIYVNDAFVVNTTNTSYVPANLLTTQTYTIKIIAKADNFANSNMSPQLSFKKLPAVSGLAVNKDLLNYFSWNLLTDGGNEIASCYEIKSVQNVSEFNFIVGGGITQQSFEYYVAGLYDIQIRAIGNSVNSGLAYINSNYSGAIELTILDNVKNLRIENNVLKFNPSPLYVNNQTKPDLFMIEIYDYLISETMPVDVVEQSGEQYYYNFEGINAGNYVVKITSVGTQNNKLNSAYALILNAVVLTAPNNLRGLNGQLYFDENKTEGFNITFEVYLNNEHVLTLTDSSLSQTKLINNYINNPNTSYSLKLRAVASNAIYSQFSEDVEINKLSNVTNAYIVNVNNVSKLYWTNISNASAYRIYTGDLVELEGLEYYNNEFNYFEVTLSGTDGFVMPNNLNAGVYNFKLMAVGNSTESGSSDVIYLNSNISSQNVNFNVIENPSTITLTNGVINWQGVVGASKYLLRFYNTLEVYEDTVIYYTTNVTGLSFDINRPEFGAGTYTLRLYALGDGVNYLFNSNFSELIITRGSAPAEYSIRNGYLSWSVSYNLIKQYATGSLAGTLNSGDTELLSRIFKGETEDINPVLINNLYPLFNVEFTVNGVKMNVKPTFVTNSSVNNKFYLGYDLALSPNTYVISARAIGNTTLLTHSETGQNLSFISDALPQMNYSYSLPTQNITAYKLDSPVTPVLSEHTSSVYNDYFYWSVVTKPNSTIVNNYCIVAQQIENRTSSIGDYVVVSAGLVGSIKITDIEDENLHIKIPAGYPYYIAVFAMGTLNSTQEGGPYYLTSAASNISTVEVLSEPNLLRVVNGEVSFVVNSKAEKHILRIWNKPQLEFEQVIHSELNGNIAVEIEITNDTFNPISPKYNPNIRLVNGIVYYNFENNSLFPYFSDTYYKVSVRAIGNGVSLITSTENPDNRLNVSKWNNVSLVGSPYDITVENGMFKWKHVSFTYLGQKYYPNEYKLTIYKTLNTPTGSQAVPYDVIVNKNDSSEFVYYELPDTANFEAFTIINGNAYPYIYSVTVSALGSVVGTSGTISFVTGDSTLSKQAERLKTTTSISTESGIVVWALVSNASGYNVLISESALEINNGNRAYFEFDNTFNPGVYNVKIKAKSSSVEYLNGRVSPSIKILKLEDPNLRIENGTLKWNNTDLPSAIAISVNLQIEGPAGFNANNLEQLSGIMFEYNNGKFIAKISASHVVNTITGLSLRNNPTGVYNIVIKYIGSTGSITSGSDVYYLVSSDSVTIEFAKLNSPSTQLGTETINNNIKNHVKWQAVPNATNYNVIAIKRDASNNILLSTKFNLFTNSGYFTYSSQTNQYKFDLQAVSDYDDLNISGTKFGNSYEIYVEAYGNDVLYSSGANKFTLSDYSNVLYIEIPLIPANLTLTEYGLVKWDNLSNTIPVLEISYRYLDSDTYTPVELIELPLGTVNYKLTTISPNYRIRIQSITGSLDEILQQSPFSNLITGGFTLFESGDGSENNPYIISNGLHLFNINYYTDAYFELGSNISTVGVPQLNEWKPIGVASQNIEESEFTGSLDGKGYSVNSLTYTTLSTTELAFIKTIGVGGVVKDITINLNSSNLNVDRFAGIAIYNYGLIENVTITGSIHLRQAKYDIFVAGAVVYNQANAVVRKVVNNAALTGMTNNSTNTTTVGGIVHTNNGLVSQSGNNGAITGTAIAGVVYLNNNEVIESYNKGQLNAVINAGYGKTVVIGGLVARNELNAKVSYSYVHNNGNVNLTNGSSVTAYVGGLIGNNASSQVIRNSYVLFMMGMASGPSQIGTIAGTSFNSLNNYNKIYYLDNQSGYLPLGAGSSIVNGITTQSESYMKSAGFVTDLNTLLVFKYNANNYPTLIWEW